MAINRWDLLDTYDDMPGGHDYLVTVTRGFNLADFGLSNSDTNHAITNQDSSDTSRSAGIQHGIFTVSADCHQTAKTIAVRILAAVCRIDDGDFTISTDALDDLLNAT